MQLQDYLKEHGESKAAFAARIGHSKSTVCRWINGETLPNLHALCDISFATAGAVQPEDFLRCELQHRKRGGKLANLFRFPRRKP